MIPPFTESRAATETLFRFLHVKQPSLHPANVLLEDDKIITYPDFADSEILDGILSAPNEAAGRALLETNADAFTPYASARAMRMVSPNLMTLALWLDANKADLLSAEIATATTGCTALSSADEHALWDNLYYQYLRNTSDKLRDIAILLLRANNFFNAWVMHVALALPYDAAAKARFQRLAGANVLIPKILAMHKQATPQAIDLDAPLAGDAVLYQLLNQAAFRYQAGLYEGLMEEFTAVENEFLRNSAAAYQAARMAHEATIAELRAEAEPEVDPVTGEITYPGLELPEFTFEPDVLLDNTYLTAHLSAFGYIAYSTHVQPYHQLLTELLPALQSRVKAAYQVLLDNAKPAFRTVAFNGSVLHLEETPAPDRIAIKAFRLPGTGNRFTFFVCHVAKELSQQLTSVTLVNDSNSDTAVEWQDVGGLRIFQLFAEGLEVIPASPTFTLSSESGATANESYDFEQAELLGGQARFGNPSPERNYLDGEPGTPWISLYGVRKVGIGEYKRVEQKICCYIEGEVSHIENIMAREYKERTSRNLLQTETTIEESEEREIEKLTDSTTTDRYEMQSEISKALEEVKTQNWGASASVNAHSPNVSVQTTGYFNSTSSSSSSANFSEAESFAKEVTQRALERIVQKVSWKRTSRVLQEYEDTHKHGYDNTQGTEHVVGIYRWVDKIYKNNLVNYGKRLMYELMIPEPAKMFKKALENAPATIIGQPPLAPVGPFLTGLNGPNSVSRSNYGFYAAMYGASVTAPLPATVSTSLAKAGNLKDSRYVDTGDGSLWKDAQHFELEIPDNYECKRARVMAIVTRQGSSYFGANKLFVGSYDVWIGDSASTPVTGAVIDFSPASVEKVLPVTIRTIDASTFTLNVVAECILKPDIFQAWQNETFAAIMEGYERKLQAYNDAMAAYTATLTPAEQSRDYNFNPNINRTIEIREIKRIAIELMTAPFGIDTGRSNYMPFAGGYYPVRQDAAFGTHAAFARFFEKAFEWEIMSYTFHPYFWANEQDWVQLINTTSSSDFIFQSFLQAGMAQAVLPVRPGFEQAVTFFLDTGTLWNGTGFALEDDDEVYLSLLQDLQFTEGEVEATWTTRVPTALTIIQSNAAALEADGLPCYCEDGTPIATGDSILLGADTVEPAEPANPLCSEFASQVAILQADYDTAWANYTLGSVNCTSSLSILNDLSDAIQALIAAAPDGCSTAAAETLDDLITTRIATLTAICG